MVYLLIKKTPHTREEVQSVYEGCSPKYGLNKIGSGL